MIYFTADHHFGHKNIIRFCNRPFKSVEEMDETLVNNWNSKVSGRDQIFIVGDFALAPYEKVLTYIKRLNGTKIFIEGSHDRWMKKARKNLSDFPHTTVIMSNNLIYRVKTKYNEITLCHFAMRRWPKSHYGTWHLYGHSHGKLPSCGLSFDIGVDCHNFYPISLDEVKSKMEHLNAQV